MGRQQLDEDGFLNVEFVPMEELVEDCSEEKSENNSEAAAGVAEDSAKKISLELDSENLSSQQVGRKIKISTRKH